MIYLELTSDNRLLVDEELTSLEDLEQIIASKVEQGAHAASVAVWAGSEIEQVEYVQAVLRQARLGRIDYRGMP